MQELWKDIEGYDGRYQVSNFGRVRSVVWETNRIRVKFGKTKNYKVKGKILKPTLQKIGYLVLSLRKNKKTKLEYVHRLVAKQFLQNTQLHKTVNHKDGNKSNNLVTNLEWCSQKYQNQHAIDMCLRVMPKGKDHCCFGLKKEEIFKKGRPISHSSTKSSAQAKAIR